MRQFSGPCGRQSRVLTEPQSSRRGPKRETQMVCGAILFKTHSSPCLGASVRTRSFSIRQANTPPCDHGTALAVGGEGYHATIQACNDQLAISRMGAHQMRAWWSPSQERSWRWDSLPRVANWVPSQCQMAQACCWTTDSMATWARSQRGGKYCDGNAPAVTVCGVARRPGQSCTR